MCLPTNKMSWTIQASEVEILTRKTKDESLKKESVH